MRHNPPESLVELLGQLGLAESADFQAVAGRARRMARGLPLFESVWVDALTQANILTAFQAAEINARRGEVLRVGPYVLDVPIGSLQYANIYTAHAVETGERVLIVTKDISTKTSQESGEILDRLKKLVADSVPLESSSHYLLPVVAAGVDAGQAWAVCRAENGFNFTDCHSGGQSAIEWMIHNGRFPPPAVLELARAMTYALTELHSCGLSHGDIRAETLFLTASGDVLLLQPGLRAVFRPTESHASAELPPQAYDGLAPERSAQAISANPLADIFACGCLWWHLLTARPALPGGNGLAKMRAAQTFDIPPVEHLAPDTPESLAVAIKACIARDPAARPQSFEQLREMLGTNTGKGRRLLYQPSARSRGISQLSTTGMRSIHSRSNFGWAKTGKFICIAASVILIAGAAWLAISGNWKTLANLGPTSRDSEKAVAKDTVTPPPPVTDSQPEEKLTRPETTKTQLDSETSIAAETLDLSPGQTVRVKGAARGRLLVPSGGLVVDVDDLRFENIDFVWQHVQDDNQTSPKAALIDLRAPTVNFQGCTFSSQQDSKSAPVAIRWTYPLDIYSAELSLPSGSIRLENCVFTGVSAAIDCNTAAAISIEATNILYLGSGPFVRLENVPRSDEPLSLNLSKITLRDSGPLLLCPSASDSKPARLSIKAVASVFIPAVGNGLIVLSGQSSPQGILEQIEWTGQGSLVATKTPITQWQHGRGPDSPLQVLDDTAVSIAGLVRGDVQFAAPAAEGIKASQITRWQAPLRSPNPPGVDVELLPKKK